MRTGCKLCSHSEFSIALWFTSSGTLPLRIEWGKGEWHFSPRVWFYSSCVCSFPAFFNFTCCQSALSCVFKSCVSLSVFLNTVCLLDFCFVLDSLPGSDPGLPLIWKPFEFVFELRSSQPSGSSTPMIPRCLRCVFVTIERPLVTCLEHKQRVCVKRGRHAVFILTAVTDELMMSSVVTAGLDSRRRQDPGTKPAVWIHISRQHRPEVRFQRPAAWS